MIGEVSSKFAWYVARASGLVAWSIVTASIVWGLALSTRIIRRKGIPAWLLDLHKFLGTLSIVFVAVHIVGLWADNYTYFGPRELFVPMASAYRPLPTAWGVVATYLLVAIESTSWVMRYLPRKLWRRVHLMSFVLFASATVHGFTAGADNGNLVVQWLALTGGLLVFFLVVFRLLAPRRANATQPRRVERAAVSPLVSAPSSD